MRRSIIGIIGAREAYFLVALAFAKLIATSMTVAATRVGGVFTPALFIGATLGGGLATAASDCCRGSPSFRERSPWWGWPGSCRSDTRSLDGDHDRLRDDQRYDLILPLMLTGAIAYITARRIHPHSIYSEWLVRKGEKIAYGRDTALLERLDVRSCYNPDPHVIGETATVPQILKAIGASTQTEFPVVDGELHFLGMLTYGDLRTVIAESESLQSGRRRRLGKH